MTSWSGMWQSSYTPKQTQRTGPKLVKNLFLSLYGASLLSTAWMASDLPHSRGRMPRSQWTVFCSWQAWRRPVQLPVSIPSGLTVKFSNGWRVTSIQLHVDGFYLMVLFCQSQRIYIQHQTNWCALCHATAKLSKCPRKDFCSRNARNQRNKFSCCWHWIFRDFGLDEVWLFILC